MFGECLFSSLFPIMYPCDDGNANTEGDLCTENGHCKGTNLPRHCVMSEWSEWSTCSKGKPHKRTRIRDVETYPAYGGDACSTELSQHKICPPVNCIEAPWTTWSSCRLLKGVWSKISTRRIEVKSKYGGRKCGSTFRQETCEPVDCILSDWSDWSKCFMENSQKEWMYTRSRKIASEPQAGGRACPNSNDVYNARSLVGPFLCKFPWVL